MHQSALCHFAHAGGKQKGQKACALCPFLFSCSRSLKRENSEAQQKQRCAYFTKLIADLAITSSSLVGIIMIFTLEAGVEITPPSWPTRLNALTLTS